MILGRVMFACLYLFLINRLLKNSVGEAATFAILVGACGWMATLDFGMGFFVKNLLIAEGGKSRCIKSYIVLAKLLILITVILNYFGSQYLSSFILNQTEDQDLYLVLSTLLILSSYQLMLQKVLIGLEQYRLLSFMSVTPYIASIIAILSFPDITFITAALILYAPPIILSLLISMIIFYPYNFNCRDISKEGLRVCGSFFMLSLVGSLVLSTDFIWIKKIVLNEYQILEYTTTYYIYSFLFAFMAYSLLILWPTLAKNISNKLVIEKYIKQTLILCIVILIIGSSILALFHDYIFKHLLDGYDVRKTESMLLVICGVFLVFSLRIYGDIYSTLFQIRQDFRAIRNIALIQCITTNLLYYVLTILEIGNIFMIIVVNIIIFMVSSLLLRNIYEKKYSRV